MYIVLHYIYSGESGRWDPVGRVWFFGVVLGSPESAPGSIVRSLGLLHGTCGFACSVDVPSVSQDSAQPTFSGMSVLHTLPPLLSEPLGTLKASGGLLSPWVFGEISCDLHCSLGSLVFAVFAFTSAVWGPMRQRSVLSPTPSSILLQPSVPSLPW